MPAHAVSRSTAESTLISQFEGRRELARSHERAAAFRRFADRGLPTRRVESWHYTDLRAAMADAAPLAPAPDRAQIESAARELGRRKKLGAARLVLLNGRFVDQLSDGLPAGAAVVRRGGKTLAVDDPMVALAEAMSLDGCAVEVSGGAELDGPVEFLHLVSGEGPLSVYSRMEIIVGAGARASFIETFAGSGASVQRHALTTLTLAEGATLKHAAIVDSQAELHLESQVIEIGAGAELKAFALVSGGTLSRRQLFVRMVGEKAKAALGGLALLDGERRADTTLQLVHSAPGGTSREFYRAIVDDEAAGTFQGKVIVANGAQKTDGAMKSQAVLLSPRAQMNAKPELEIFADDVVCGHGATVGSLDPEQIFYLRTRGVRKDEAEAMLLEAFGGEAIERIGDDALAGVLHEAFRAWLASRGKGPMEARR
ncbi:MAG TPA: Fe-S cluster assembly protein SufD [Roseiarcus sp.]|nr:Fe-S cluster assembly protein SufD [Roseiarcus sp.]